MSTPKQKKAKGTKMKTSLPITVDVEIELPVLPNFIRLKNGVTIDIKDLHAPTLSAIADRWKEAFLVHAEERRRGLNPEP